MALFTSSPTESPFAPPNVLFDAASGQALQHGKMNDLLLLKQQQENSATDQEMVARAAAYLNGLPEDQRAAAYGPIVQDLQGRGFAKQAPSQYPGHERIAALASMGTPSKDTLSIGASQAAKAALYPGAAPGPGASAAPNDGAASDGAFAANNPLNIRFVGQEGASNTRGFAAFPTPEAGQAATDKQFAAYAERGINTLTGLISRWAPPNENDTAGYIARVSKATGIDPNAPIDLRDPKQSRVIQQAMAGVEANKNGRILPLEASAAPGQGGVAGRIPGAFDVAGQTAAPTTAAALLPNGLKPEQDRQMQVLRTTRGVTAEEMLAAQERFLASNRQEATAARVAAHQAAEDKLAQEKAGREAQSHAGTGVTNQDITILEKGDVNSREYAGAYNRQAEPKFLPDGSKIVPDMSAYDPPKFKGAGSEGGMTKAAIQPPAAVVDGMLGNVQAVRQIDKTLAELDRRKGEGVGFFAGNTPAAAINRLDPGGVTLRALIADIGSLKLHDRSGAAVTAAETPRLVPFIPSITDPPEAIRDKLQKFRREYQAALNDSYQVYGPTAGGKALEPVEEMLKGYQGGSGNVAPGARPPLSSFQR